MRPLGEICRRSEAMNRFLHNRREEVRTLLDAQLYQMGELSSQRIVTQLVFVPIPPQQVAQSESDGFIDPYTIGNYHEVKTRIQGGPNPLQLEVVCKKDA